MLKKFIPLKRPIFDIKDLRILRSQGPRSQDREIRMSRILIFQNVILDHDFDTSGTSNYMCLLVPGMSHMSYSQDKPAFTSWREHIRDHLKMSSTGADPPSEIR